MAVRIQTNQTLYLYEDEGDTIFPATGAWTILWKYRHESNVGGNSLLAVLYGDFAATVFCGAYTVGNAVTLRGANGGAETLSAQPFSFETGREYNLGLQRNNAAGTITLFNDGVPVLSMEFSPVAGTAGFRSLHFAGFGGSPAGHLDSTWARMRIWTAVLTEAEQKAEFRSATAVRTSGLVNDWPMDPGAGRFTPASGTTQAIKIFPTTSIVDGTGFGTGPAEHIFRASGSGADQTLTATSISAAVPVSPHAGSQPGVVQGDLEELWVSAGVLSPGTPPTMAAPAGWTRAGFSAPLSVAGGAVNARIHLFHRIAPASNAAAVVNTGGPAAVLVYVRSSHSNPDATTPFGQVIFNRGGPANPAVVSALTAARSRSRLSIFVTQGAAQGITPPSDMTERLDNEVAGISMADKIQSAAGSSGTKSFTLPSSTDFGWGFAEYYSQSAQTTLAASASAQAAATGALAVHKRLAGSGAAQAGGAAALLRGVRLAAAGVANAAGSAAIAHQVPLSGSAAAVASGGAELALAVTLVGSALAQALAAAGITVGKPLAGAAAAQASGAAALQVSAGNDLAASAQAQAGGAAVLSLSVSLSAAAQAQALAAAGLVVNKRLSAAAAAEASGSAGLVVSKPLGASGAAQASAGANLQVNADNDLAANAQAQASAGATLALDVPLTAAAIAEALASGSLSVVLVLSAAALSRASGSAQLVQGVRLTAGALALASASAALTVTGEYARAPAGAGYQRAMPTLYRPSRSSNTRRPTR